MKKWVAILLAFSLLMAFPGCGSAKKASDVSIDALTAAIKDFSKNAKKSESATGDGFEITIDCGNNILIKATTNKSKQIISADIILEDALFEYYDSLTMEQVALDILDWENVPMNKLFCSLFVMRTATHIIPTLTGESGFVKGIFCKVIYISGTDEDVSVPLL